MNTPKKILLVLGNVNKKIVITSVEDTYVIQSSPTLNVHTSATLALRVSATAQRHPILKFDLSTIPANSKIISAILNLYTNTVPVGANNTLTVYPILVANSDMVFTEMAWNIRKTDTAWAGDTGGDGGADGGCFVSGTDYDSTSIGSCVFPTGAVQGTRLICLLNKDTVQGWLTNNYGIIILPSSTETMALFSVNNVDGNAIYRPTLEITYK